MTREEIRAKTIEQLERVSRNIASIGETKDFTGFAIEALKQKPVLDKIRADILERSFEVPYENQAFDYGIRLVKLEDVEHILDTYKEE